MISCPVDAGGRSQRQKTRLKTFQKKRDLSRVREILVVNFGHILHIDASQGQKPVLNFPLKVHEGKF